MHTHKRELYRAVNDRLLLSFSKCVELLAESGYLRALHHRHDELGICCATTLPNGCAIKLLH